MEYSAIIIWLIAVAVFVLAEFISLGLTSIWFAGGALAATIVAICGGPIWLQIAIFIIVSAILLVCTRPIATKYLNSKTEKTNAESLINQYAIVLSDINNLEGTGQAKVGGMEWTARSTNDSVIIKKGATVIIKEIKGVKLIVEEVSTTEV